MVTSRKSIGAPIALLMFFAVGAPAAAQAPAGAFTLSGMTNAALWVSGTAPESGTASAAERATALPLARPSYLPDASVRVASSAGRVTAGSTAPVQAQDSGGGFPWLEAGIGAAVGILFIQAVATANSGDAAELPRGGIAVVLPSS